MITNSRFRLGIKYIRYVNQDWTETVKDKASGTVLAQSSGNVDFISYDVNVHARFSFGMVEIERPA